MRFLRCFVLLPCWVVCLTAQAQTDADTSGFEGFKSTKFPFRQNVIKSNLIPVFVGQIPFCGELRFTYERMLVHNHSLTIGASYNFPSLMLLVMPSALNPQNAVLRQVSMRGGRLTFGYRYYPIKRTDAPKGLFFGPYFSYNFVKIKERRGAGSYEVIHFTNASMIAGYQIHLSRGVFMEFFGGVGYRNNFIDFHDAVSKTTTRSDFTFIQGGTPLRHVKLILQMNIGYGF